MFTIGSQTGRVNDEAAFRNISETTRTEMYLPPVFTDVRLLGPHEGNSWLNITNRSLPHSGTNLQSHQHDSSEPTSAEADVLRSKIRTVNKQTAVLALCPPL